MISAERLYNELLEATLSTNVDGRKACFTLAGVKFTKRNVFDTKDGLAVIYADTCAGADFMATLIVFFGVWEHKLMWTTGRLVAWQVCARDEDGMFRQFGWAARHQYPSAQAELEKPAKPKAKKRKPAKKGAKK